MWGASMNWLGSRGWQWAVNVLVVVGSAAIGYAFGSVALFAKIVVTWYATAIGLISLWIAFAVARPERGLRADNVAIGIVTLGLAGWLWF